MTYIATKGLFDSPTQENYEGLPVRYPKQKIDENIFKNFFQKFGKYPGKQSTIKEIGPVWEYVLNRWTNSTVDVFKSLEEEDFQKLTDIYENYYVQGVSEGASSGKAFLDKHKGGNGYEYKSKKSKRNIERFKTLSNYLNYKTDNINEIYDSILKDFKIPQEPNLGQTWGWWYNDTFIHFELADYIYFSKIIINLLKEFNLNKTMFIGDGSGVLSSLIYNNYNITSSYHIDLSHFLIKQYLNNSSNNIHYYYAENFKENTIHDAQILINQDSFSEMSDESVYRYIKNAKFNNVPYILSYNKETTFEGGNKHSDFKSILLNLNYVSKRKVTSIINDYYSIELFELKK